MARLVIFGTGDIARLAQHLFTRDSEHEVVAFTVDAAYRKGDQFRGLPVVDFETVERRFPPDDYRMFVAVSYARMNRVREEKYHRARGLGYTLATYISSRCTFLTEEPVGDNCFVQEGNVVQPFVSIGNNVTLWSGVQIAHDSTIGDHCFLAPCAAVSGNVRVGPNSFLGVNSTVANGVTVAPRTLVGAGAVITKDTIEGGVYAAPRPLLLPMTSDEVSL